MQPESDNRRFIIPYIVIGLLVWGALLGLGAFAFPYFATGARPTAPDVRKPLIIMGCVAAFVSFWGVLLWFKRGKLAPFSERKIHHRDTETQREEEA